jgi:hypothetical protein
MFPKVLEEHAALKMEAENSSEIYFGLHVVTFQKTVIFVVIVKI